jgi:hypothetical protein
MRVDYIALVLRVIGVALITTLVGFLIYSFYQALIPLLQTI